MIIIRGLEYAASLRVCKPIIDQIIMGNSSYGCDIEGAQLSTRLEIREERQIREKRNLQELLDGVDEDLYNWLVRKVPLLGSLPFPWQNLVSLYIKELFLML